MTNLVIVGNGFDLCHGLDTKYSDFKEYLRSCDEQLVYLLKEFIPVKDLWSNFEENLGQVNLAEVAKHFAHKHDHPALNELFDSKIARLTADTIAAEYEGIVEKFTVDLRDYLKNFILSLAPPSKHKRLNCIDGMDDLISFNYTKTVETIYGINSELTYFIHNTANKSDETEGFATFDPNRYFCSGQDQDQGVIFGHGMPDKSPPDLPPIGRTVDGAYDVPQAYYIIQRGYENLEEYYEKSAKFVDKILPELKEFLDNLYNIEKIYIIGHSLSVVDIDYFIEIGNHFSPSMEYHVTYYGETQKNDIRQAVKRFVKDPRKVTYYDLSDLNCNLYYK